MAQRARSHRMRMRRENKELEAKNDYQVGMENKELEVINGASVNEREPCGTHFPLALNQFSEAFLFLRFFCLAQSAQR